MRSSNPRVLQVQEEYFERIRQGMDGKVDSVVLYRRIQEVKLSKKEKSARGQLVVRNGRRVVKMTCRWIFARNLTTMVRFLVKSRSVRVGCVLREKLAKVKTSQPTGDPSRPKSFLDNSIVKFCHLVVRSQSSQVRSKSSKSQFKSFRDNSQSFFAILQNTEKNSFITIYE